jgi:hypothetical protein
MRLNCGHCCCVMCVCAASTRCRVPAAYACAGAACAGRARAADPRGQGSNSGSGERQAAGEVAGRPHRQNARILVHQVQAACMPLLCMVCHKECGCAGARRKQYVWGVLRMNACEQQACTTIPDSIQASCTACFAAMSVIGRLFWAASPSFSPTCRHCRVLAGRVCEGCVFLELQH